MNLFTIFLRYASIQFLWGTLIAIAISYIVGMTNIVRLSNTLFVTAGILIYFGYALFRPKEAGLGIYSIKGLKPEEFVRIQNGKKIKVEFELSENEDENNKFSEEEKNKYPFLYWLSIFIRTWGISFTLIFYAIFVHQIFGN
jgi:hypothetical protein